MRESLAAFRFHAFSLAFVQIHHRKEINYAFHWLGIAEELGVANG
jgi:hypothetical protein